MYFGGCSRLNFSCGVCTCSEGDEIVIRRQEQCLEPQDDVGNFFAPMVTLEGEKGDLCVSNPGEYNVCLDRSDGARLGVDIDHSDATTLLVERLTGGLVLAWNAANPGCCIEEGDRIVAVNSVCGDSASLIGECKKSQVLHLKLRRRAYCAPLDNDPAEERQGIGGASAWPPSACMESTGSSVSDGFQRITHTDGSTYAGQILGGRRHGHGLWHFFTGQYDGEWKADLQHGKGRQTWSDGRTYEGQFQMGKFAGHGRNVWRTSKGQMVYEGQYHGDLKHGSGKFVWADGRIYDGEWHWGKRHGRGLYTDAQNRFPLQAGYWIDGRFDRWEGAAGDKTEKNHEYSENYDVN